MPVWRGHRLLACLGFPWVWPISVLTIFSSTILLKWQRSSTAWGKAWSQKSSHLVQNRGGANFLYQDNTAGKTAVSGKFRSKSLLQQCFREDHCVPESTGSLQFSFGSNCTLGRTGAKSSLTVYQALLQLTLDCVNLPLEEALLPLNENLYQLFTFGGNFSFIPTPSQITGVFIWPSKTAVNFHLSIFLSGSER